ncbi:MAG: hypothetical protein QXW80_04465 [Candidatus Micrarchaeia archaeon]
MHSYRYTSKPLSTTVSLRRRIHLDIKKQNGIVEMANKTMREEMSPLIITDYKNAQTTYSEQYTGTTKGRCTPL